MWSFHVTVAWENRTYGWSMERNHAASEKESDMDTTSILASTQLPNATDSRAHPTASQVDRFYDDHGTIPFWNVWVSVLGSSFRKLRAKAKLLGEMSEAAFAKSANVE